MAGGLRNGWKVNLSNYSNRPDDRLHICTRWIIAVTISGISKFGKIVKLLIWVVGVQRLNYVLKRIFHSCRHRPLWVGSNLKQGIKATQDSLRRINRVKYKII